MRSSFNVIFNIFKLLMGAFIIITGMLGVFINLHDWFFLLLNLVFLGFGILLFLTPITEAK